MDALDAARDSAAAVGTVGSHFMLDGATYKRGAELGFAGLDFYVAGRGGVLGDVDAGVVAAAFGFFEPEHVRTQWEIGTAVLPARHAAGEFAGAGYAWADAHVAGADVDLARLAELAARVGDGARPAGAPVFAAWRTLDVPADPARAAFHHLNGLRELRNALHVAAVLAVGLTPLEAVSFRQPHMVPVFGWPGAVEVGDDVRARWQQAEDATDVAVAHAYDALDAVEREEFVRLANTLHEAVAPAG